MVILKEGMRRGQPHTYICIYIYIYTCVHEGCRDRILGDFGLFKVESGPEIVSRFYLMAFRPLFIVVSCAEIGHRNSGLPAFS